jgi:hypothetical protein
MKSRKQGILEEVLNSSVKGFSSFSNVCTKKTALESYSTGEILPFSRRSAYKPRNTLKPKSHRP